MLLIGTFVFGSGILKYQILKPTKNPLPKDVKTLAFAFRNIHFAADSITKYYKHNKETLVDNTDYRDKIAKAAYEGFCSVVAEQYPLANIPLILMPETQGNSERFIPSLAWEKVDKICKKHNADVLVSLEDISIFNSYETWYDGEFYNGVANISSFHSWKIYDPMTRELVFEETKLDSLQSHEMDYYMDRMLKEKLPSRSEIMEVVAFSMGENLGKSLVPNWETVYREYYDGGNRNMREAAKKVEAKKWQEALQLWEVVKREGSKKYKARAAFNCAIINERIGNISQALIDVQQSINFYKNLSSSYEDERAVAVRLQSILKKREQEVALLKKQQSKE